MAIRQPETKWQRLWRLMKKWHYVWLPFVIVFFDRLLIMWPYIPIGEATVYMKAQAIETFDASLWWVIHVAETIVLTYLWLFIVSAHMYITMVVIVKLNKIWKELKYIRQIEKDANITAHEAVAQDQVRLYFKKIHKQAKQDQFILNDVPFGQYLVKFVPWREYRQMKDTMPNVPLSAYDKIAASYENFTSTTALYQLVVGKGWQYVQQEIMPDPDGSKRRKALEEVMQYLETTIAAARSRGAGRPEATEVKVVPSSVGPTAETTRTAGEGVGGPPASPAGPQENSAAPLAAVNQEAESKGLEEHKPAAAGVGSGRPAAPAESGPADGPGESCQEGEKPAVVSEPPAATEEKQGETMELADQVVSSGAEPGGQAGAVAEPVQEQAGVPLAAVEAAPVSQVVEPPPVKISVAEALAKIQNMILERNKLRRSWNKPPLTAAEEEAIRRTFFSQVDPEELAAWRAGQEAPAAAGEPEGGQHAPVGTVQAMHRAEEEEGGLVGVGADDRDEEEPEDDTDDIKDDMDEQVSADQWTTALSQADGDPLVAAIMLMMKNRDEWRGAPNELLVTIGLYAPDEVKESKTWPKNAAWLVRRDLKDRKSSLAQAGLSCDPSKDYQGRWVVIKWAKNHLR